MKRSLFVSGPLTFVALTSVGVGACVLACGGETEPGSDDADASRGDSCEALANEASSAMRQTASENVACSADQECVLADVSTSCSDDCGGTFVNVGAEAALQATRARAESSTCASFTAAGCTFGALPCPAPSSEFGACVSGRCSIAQPGSKPFCDGYQGRARDALQAVLDQHTACTADTDCVTVGFSASCFDGCSRVIAKEGQAAYETARHDVDASSCAMFSGGGCTFDAPPCDAPPAPTCVAGRCQ